MWQGEVAVSDSTIREKNLTVWNEVYEGVDVEELVSEVRGGSDHHRGSEPLVGR